jgi:hypothetical protein
VRSLDRGRKIPVERRAQREVFRGIGWDRLVEDDLVTGRCRGLAKAADEAEENERRQGEDRDERRAIEPRRQGRLAQPPGS